MTTRFSFLSPASLFRSLAVLALGMLPVAVAQAQQVVTFSIAARTPGYGGGGYTSNTDYSFQFVLSPEGTFTSNVNSTFNASSNVWREADGNVPALYTSVTGPLSGTFIGTKAGSRSTLSTYSNGQFGLEVIPTASALLTPDSTPISYLNMSVGGLTFLTQPADYSAAFTDPVIYFAERVGTYTPSWGSVSVGWNDGGSAMSFTVTSFEISVSGSPIAVPEPSTYAAMAGAAALGFAAWRRRRAARHLAAAAA